MARKGYLIEKYNNMRDAYTCGRLVEEAARAGMELRIIGVHDTVVRPDGIYNAGARLEKADFVINRYKWGKVMEALCSLAERVYNPLDRFRIYVNKYEQTARLSSPDFLMPRSCLGTAMLPYRELRRELGGVFVAKGLESSMGQEIFLISDPERYKALLTGYGMEKEWLFEEFIAGSAGRDLRFYSIRGEVTACMQRKSAGDFRANVALGASVEPYPVTPAIRRIARDLYDQTGLDLLGIDLMFGEEKPYFCEINVMPGLEGIEKASGLNIAGRVIRMIREDAAGNEVLST